MSWFTIMILCFIAPAINSFMNTWRKAVIKKEDDCWEDANKILSDIHPIFNLITILLMTVCPIAILVIATTNVIAML